jgi:uncharacterized protein YjdB
MNLRRPASLSLSLLALSATMLLAGCSALQTLSVLPAAGTVTLTGIGQTAQFTALGTSRTGSAAPTTTNISSSVSWSASNTSVATVSSTGLATAVGYGTTQITAESNGIIASSSLTVTAPSGSGGSTGGTPSITIIPGTQSVAVPGNTAQFIAIGTNAAGATSNLTNQVTWSSSSGQIATVVPGTGFATAVGAGTATITALYNNNGSIVTGTTSFTVLGGTSEQFTGLTVLPGTESLSGSGQTAQLIALGKSGVTGLNLDVTGSPSIKWTSSIPSYAIVGPTGLITGISAGSTTITAVLTNPDGTVVSNSATVTISSSSAPEPLLSLTILPSSITVGNLQDTAQFLAIGTFSSVPYVRDLTNSPTLTWLSAEPSVFPVNTNTGGGAGNSAGIVTAYGVGTATIIAEAKSTDGTIQTATATFICPPPGTPVQPGQCYQGSQAPALLASLTVYNEGANSTGWLVTAPSATKTPNVLHCGPGSISGGSICVATYPIDPVNGTTVMLTAPSLPGVNFGGWSYNCTPSDVNGKTVPAVGITAAGPNYCVVTFTASGTVANPANTNVTVGAIFN